MDSDVDDPAMEATPSRFDVESQLEMIEGMNCPYPRCNGVLRREDDEVQCEACSRLVVRFE